MPREVEGLRDLLVLSELKVLKVQLDLLVRMVNQDFKDWQEH